MANEKDTLEIEVKATLSGDAAFKSILGDLEKIRKEADKVKQSAAGIGGASGSIKSAATALGEVESAATKASKGVGEAEKSTKSVGTAFTQMSTLATAAWAAAGAAVTKFAADSVKSFNNFEKGIAQTFTLMPNASAAAMDKMATEVRQFSLEVGRTTDEVLPALFFAISSGVPPDNVFEFMKVASDAALGGAADLQTVVDGLTSVVNSYGADVIDVGRASDLMFQAVNLGKIEFDELSRSLYNVVPVASSMKLGFDQVTGALAAMTAQGVPTNVATTQLRQLLLELSKEGTKASIVFQEMAGVSFRQFIESGGNLQDALKLMEQSAQQSGVGLNDLFGSVEAGGAALVLTGKGTAAFTEALGAMEDSFGATEAAAERMKDTNAHVVAEMTAAWENLKLVVGDSLAPTVTAAMTVTTSALTFVSGSYEDKAQIIVNSNLESAASLWELQKAYEGINSTIPGANSVMADAGGVADQVSEGYREIAVRTLAMTDANADLETSLRQVFGRDVEIARGRVVVNGLILGTVENLEAEVAAQKMAADVRAAAASDAHLLAAAQAEQTRIMADAQEAAAFDTRYLNLAVGEATAGIDGMEGAVEGTNRALERYGENARQTNSSLGQLASTMSSMSLAPKVQEEQGLKGAAEKLAAIEAQEAALKELEEATKAQSAAWQAYVSSSTSAFSSSEGMFGDLFKAYDELEKAENTQINLNAGRLWEYGQTTEQIAELSGQLAADLSDDQKKAYQDILGTVEEGSAEWLSAYNALQGDLSDSARQGLVAQMAELQGEASELAGGGLEAVYGADTRAAEEARAAIEEANKAIIASYKATTFEALLAQTGVTESTLALGVQLGIMTEAEAAARLEFTNTTLALTELASSQEFAAASTRDQAEATQLLILGYASSAEEAAELAASISDKGGLSESLLSATSLTEELNIELAKIEGDKTGKVNVSVDGIESLREAAGLTEQIRRGNRSEAGATGDILPQARAVGGDVDAGSPYLVGEQGAELIFPSKSGFVATAAQTRQLLNEARQAQAQAQIAAYNNYATNTANLTMTNNIYAGNQPAQDIANTIDRRGKQSARNIARLLGQKI